MINIKQKQEIRSNRAFGRWRKNESSFETDFQLFLITGMASFTIVPSFRRSRVFKLKLSQCERVVRFVAENHWKERALFYLKTEGLPVQIDVEDLSEQKQLRVYRQGVFYI